MSEPATGSAMSSPVFGLDIPRPRKGSIPATAAISDAQDSTAEPRALFRCHLASSTISMRRWAKKTTAHACSHWNRSAWYLIGNSHYPTTIAVSPGIPKTTTMEALPECPYATARAPAALCPRLWLGCCFGLSLPGWCVVAGGGRVRGRSFQMPMSNQCSADAPLHTPREPGTRLHCHS